MKSSILVLAKESGPNSGSFYRIVWFIEPTVKAIYKILSEELDVFRLMDELGKNEICEELLKTGKLINDWERSITCKNDVWTLKEYESYEEYYKDFPPLRYPI